jgi:hypothetical protein
MKKIYLTAVALIISAASLFASNFSGGKFVEIKPPVLNQDFKDFKVEKNDIKEKNIELTDSETKPKTSDILIYLRKKIVNERYKINDLREFAFISPNIVYKE